MTTRRSIQMFLLAIAAIATVPFSAHAQYQRPAQVTRQVDARAITWQRIGQSITVEFDENKLEDVMRFISDFSGADLEPLWEDDRRSGLDRDAEVTLSVENVTVLTLIERVLEQVQDDFDQNTWQFSRAGALEMGPKSRLNRKAFLKVYDVNDLLYQIPDYQDVPTLDLDQILNQSQQGGGGGGGSIFEEEDVDAEDGLTREQLIERLEDLIVTSIEPEQWARAAGDGATLRSYDGHMLIRAPDYIHRQIVGYPFARRGHNVQSR